MTLSKKLLTSLAVCAGLSLNAATNELVLQTNKPGAPIQPTMYGLFFEDINYAADGGLYADIENEGFFGIGVKKGEEYRFSVWARNVGQAPAKIRVELVSPESMGETQTIASKEIEIKGDKWTKYTAVITPSVTDAKSVLRVFLAKPDNAVVDLEHVSLFPVDTWNGHETRRP